MSSSENQTPNVVEQTPAAAASTDKKKDKKKEKEEKKAQQQQAQFERNAPVVDDVNAGQFGDLVMIQSKFKTDRVWTNVASLDESTVGQNVWLRGRLHTVRAKGKFAFLLLRRGFASVQCLAHADLGVDGDVPRDMIKFISKIPSESVIEVYGQVTKPEKPVTSASQSAVEIKINKLFVISASVPILPFQLEDASRPEEKEGEETKNADGTINIRVGQDLRLDNRWLDLRTPANHAIFRIQSRVGQYFRQYFLDRDFVEIHTPKIIPGVSEGGAEVFKVGYFGHDCCLAQSPQLYKQMGVTSDLFKVFEIGPVFRAENSRTHRHMCEFTGMDFEMEINEGYWEVTKVLGDLFVYIFDMLNEKCEAELKAVNTQFPFEPLKYRRETLVLKHKEAVDMLKEAGENIDYMDDFSTPQEKMLGRLVRAKYDTDFYIVDKYPLTARPFYTMPCPEDPKYTNSYDVFVRGEEITSGAQRIHEVDLLKKRAIECGIPEDNITKYLESFKYGAFPHGGAGIGLERVVMLFLQLGNIRKTAMFPRTPERCEP